MSHRPFRNAGLGFFLLSGITFAADSAAPKSPVGERVADFKLSDVRTSKTVSLYGFQGKKAAVLIFTGIDCPVNNLYMPRLNELAKAYQAKGVAFLGINANAAETAEQVAAHAREYRLDFPMLKDTGNVVADQLHVRRTCEVLLLDSHARLRYRGAIDNQYGVGTRKDGSSQKYLAMALDAVLANREVSIKVTAVAGCPIDRVEPIASKTIRRIRAVTPLDPAEPGAEKVIKIGEVTYAADVAVIFQDRCQSCHRPGEVAPFSLITYDQARSHARSIAEVVRERRMPPWHADPRYGHFQGDRKLTAQERAALLAWVEQGTPLGDASALPPTKKFQDGWGIGKPDIVFEMPKAYQVAAQGTLPYQRFVIPTGFTEDMWVQAAEARPGDRSVVHHIVVYVKGRRDRQKFDTIIPGHLCGYAPGDMATIYPEGTAKRVPAGSDFIMEIHYTPMGQEKLDRSSVGLVFARKPVTRQAFTLGIANPEFAIPAGATNHSVNASFTFQRDARLLSLSPHMHLRGKDFVYRAVYPDGKSETLLSIPAWDFAWQNRYRLSEPKTMPRGTRIDCLAHYDNSTANPVNPDPKRTIRWGDQTFDEMMIGYIDISEDLPAGDLPRLGSAEKR